MFLYHCLLAIANHSVTYVYHGYLIKQSPYSIVVVVAKSIGSTDESAIQLTQCINSIDQVLYRVSPDPRGGRHETTTNYDTCNGNY